MKASKKAALRWSRNPRRPVYAKHAGKAVWLDGDTRPRVPGGGPKKKR